jgi:hypothetical protein
MKPSLTVMTAMLETAEVSVGLIATSLELTVR